MKKVFLKMSVILWLVSGCNKDNDTQSSGLPNCPNGHRIAKFSPKNSSVKPDEFKYRPDGTLDSRIEGAYDLEYRFEAGEKPEKFSVFNNLNGNQVNECTIMYDNNGNPQMLIEGAPHKNDNLLHYFKVNPAGQVVTDSMVNEIDDVIAGVFYFEYETDGGLKKMSSRYTGILSNYTYEFECDDTPNPFYNLRYSYLLDLSDSNVYAFSKKQVSTIKWYDKSELVQSSSWGIKYHANGLPNTSDLGAYEYECK